MRSALSRELRSRLPERRTLAKAELHQRFWPTLRETDVHALFDLIEQELGIPAGVLRPEDSLDQLLAPLSFRRPLWWFRVEPALEDATSELNYELHRRLRTFQSDAPADLRCRTVDEWVRAWCGQLPSR